MTDSPRPDAPSSAPPRTGGVDVSTKGDVTIGGDVVGRDKITNIVSNIFGGRDDARDRRNQLILLEKVKTFWVKGVLEKSIHSEALIELGKQTQLEAVDHPWEVVLEVPDQPSRLLPPGKKIIEIFDEMGHALLILGAPGSGKTITLLELTRDLLSRAEQDPVQPIPVVFNLSSWAERRQPLADWLVEELSAKYQIPRKIGRKWLEADDILPLLDGLDEVHAEHRAACVEAINQFQQAHGLTGIAVCSRAEDYQALATRLKLSGAIVLQPLAMEQIDSWLATGGVKLAALRVALVTDAALKELAQSPLMLSVMSLAYEGMTEDALSTQQLDTVEERRKHLFEAYTQRMFKLRGVSQRHAYDPAQTTHWLSWLAWNMTQQAQSVFLIEDLQPSWLAGRLQRWIYALLSAWLPSLWLGMGLGLFLTDPVLNSELLNRLMLGVLSGVIGGGVIGLVNGLRFESSSFDIRIASRPRWVSHLGEALFIGASVGLSTGVVRFLFELTQQPESDLAGFAIILSIIIGVFQGFIAGTVFALVFGWRGDGLGAQRDIQTIETVGWSWLLAGKGLRVGSLVGFLAGLVYSAVIGAAVYLFSATAIIKSVVDLLLLMLLAGLSHSLAFALAGGLLGMLVGGLQGKTIQTQTIPNHGVRKSATNALVVGVIFWLSGWALVGLFYGIFRWAASPQNMSSTLQTLGTNPAQIASVMAAMQSTPLFIVMAGMLSGLILGIGVGLRYGGLAVLRHFTLRLILYLDKRIPWNLARFLDYATEHIFLHKVGGGYIFIHRLLKEYFAALETGT